MYIRPHPGSKHVLPTVTAQEMYHAFEDNMNHAGLALRSRQVRGSCEQTHCRDPAILPNPGWESKNKI